MFIVTYIYYVTNMIHSQSIISIIHSMDNNLYSYIFLSNYFHYSLMQWQLFSFYKLNIGILICYHDLALGTTLLKHQIIANL